MQRNTTQDEIYWPPMPPSCLDRVSIRRRISTSLRNLQAWEKAYPVQPARKIFTFHINNT